MPYNKIVARRLPESVYETLLRMRQVDGYRDRPWGEWLTYKSREWSRTPTDSQRRREETGEGLMHIWLGNFGDNLQDIRDGLTIRDLIPKEKPTRPIVLVGRGPSFFKHEHAKLLAKYRDKIDIISTDGASPELLQSGCVPNFVMGVDGSRDKIVPFYSTPEWKKHGKEIGVVLVISSAHNVYEKCKENGSEVYWCLSLWDDWRLPESLVRWMTHMTSSEKNRNGCPTLKVGTNAGHACFALAYAILQYKTVGLVGFDMGYPANFPLEETAYYKSAQAAGVDMLHFSTVFTHYQHPLWGDAFVDPVFREYRQGMLDSLSELQGIKTINCTGGGTLYGENLECMNLKDWLESLP